MAQCRFLIDGSNLHVGGGVAVAASVISSMLSSDFRERYPGSLERVEFVISSEIASAIPPPYEIATISVTDSRPCHWASFREREYESVLTLFGPYYRERRAGVREIVGFARPRMIFDLRSSGLPDVGAGERIGNAIRWQAFKRADLIVTETNVAAERLRARLGLPVHVVPSTGIFRESRRRIKRIWSGGILNVAVVSRDYPHKNLGFLSQLARSLSKRHRIRMRFHLTLSEDEWERRRFDLGETSVNHGILSPRGIRALYESCDIAILPSVLELASGTPLDSMALGVPIFVSDLPQMRLEYGDAAGYINPFDPVLASSVLAQALNPTNLTEMINAGYRYVAKLPTPQQRAWQYLKLLTDASGG